MLPLIAERCAEIEALCRRHHVRRLDVFGSTGADDLTEAVPALATIAMTVFTYNIANGLTAGLVLHPLLKLAAGRFRELTVSGAVLGVLCLTYYLFGIPH